MSFSVASASLPAGETPVCGVTLEPFIRCRWTTGSRTQLTSLDEFPLEATPPANGSHCLRYRWLRSPFTDGEGQICHIHPDRPATMQCTIWTKLNYPLAYSYHCSADCFKQHWHLQKQYHEKALKASKAGAPSRFHAAGALVTSRAPGTSSPGAAAGRCLRRAARDRFHTRVVRVRRCERHTLRLLRSPGGARGAAAVLTLPAPLQGGRTGTRAAQR